MQRIGRLAACAAPVCPRRSGPTRWGQTAEHRQHCATVRPARPFSAVTGRRFVFAGEKHRLFSSQPGAEGPGKSTDDRPVISVVGIPDPIALIRCKIIMFLLDLYFELNMNSAEFERGVKQALVHVSNKMSRGRYHELKGLVSAEMMAYVEKRCSSLTETQRKQLSVATDDIIFVLPEDISVVHDKYGRKFCFIVMRFWLLSSHEGPDDPEALKIFKVASTEDGTPQKKIATAVYEFHGEVKRGASPDWTVTTVWHWHWNLAA
ncbi:m-AAA protease-interacting protein 1, mitochondrial [Pholidichthys leucotaenia]